jgi:hypothetical protein
MASGLGDVAGGDVRAIFVAMAAAVLFGAVHALMPGHGKTVLVSLGRPASPKAPASENIRSCSRCPLRVISGHSQLHEKESALPPKADIPTDT